MKCCDKDRPAPYVPPFVGFTEFTASIPKLYWGVKSQEQRIRAICEQLHKLACYADYIGDKVNINRKDIDWLMEQFELFKEHGFDEYYLDQVQKWIDEHLTYIFTLVAKQVYFGINEQGYFVAYIPDGWDDIVFDTGMVYGEDTYGRLILRWDVDNSGETVNQRPEDWS